ncbi:MAG: aldose epimerase family protein [Bacteroidota bacterium]
MPISKTSFGQLASGQQVDLFTLENSAGMKVRISNFGGIVTSIQVPNRNGQLGEVNLGFDNLEKYVTEHPYFGAIIGRYGNRIANGQFTLDGKTYQLATKADGNHLHGGEIGFDKKVWAAKIKDEPNSTLVLTCLSPDGEEGFPGNLNCRVTYQLTAENELIIRYHATTDQPTVLNLTNHCYFNLKDGGQTTALGHELQLLADQFTPVNAHVIPTGERQSVKNTPFDFLESHVIGERINDNHPQLKIGNGYDHNFVLNGEKGLKKAAKVVEPETGRTLEVWTTEPGVQFYTANWLDGSLTGHTGIRYDQRCAFCLETQHFPDSPNQPDFPSTVLLPEEAFDSTTIYKFGVSIK